MINLKPLILKTLKETGYKVNYFHPENVNDLPVITYREVDNRTTIFSNGEEYEAEVTFAIDIWHNDSTSEIAKLVDKKMNNIGFRRVVSLDLYEPDTKIQHKSLQYSRRISKNMLIY